MESCKNVQLANLALQVEDKFTCVGGRVEHEPTMISHTKENVSFFFFPLDDPISFMNSYPAEKGENKKQN